MSVCLNFNAEDSDERKKVGENDLKKDGNLRENDAEELLSDVMVSTNLPINFIKCSIVFGFVVQPPLTK